jgi:hypothetical protein
LSTMDDDARGMRERRRRHDAWKIFVYLVYPRECACADPERVGGACECARE